MLGLGRAVFGLQWIALFLIPIFTVATSSGWEFIGAAVAAFVGFVGMLTTVLISTLSRDLRAQQAVPPVYAILTIALWVVAIIFPLSLGHSGDTTSTPSALQNIGVSLTVTEVVTPVTIYLAIGLWIASLIALIARRTPDALVPTAVDAAMTVEEK